MKRTIIIFVAVAIMALASVTSAFADGGNDRREVCNDGTPAVFYTLRADTRDATTKPAPLRFIVPGESENLTH